MSYKWKPGKMARREFALKMQNDPNYARAYHDRKTARAEKRRASSDFVYSSAGGSYVPTKMQHDFAIEFLLGGDPVRDQRNACNMVVYGYNYNEKIHHDYIHIVNELLRTSR